MEVTNEEAKDILSDLLVEGSVILEPEKQNAVIRAAIKALDKDIPKAPKKSDKPRYGMGYEYYDWYCPACSKFLAYECDISRQDIHHCKCGQRLDWEGVEDD